LKKAGIEVLVLEADQAVGGRMKSIQVDDALIDCGAQFLSSGYSVIPKLIKETGLSNEFVSTNEWVGLVKNNDIVLIHPRKPWSLVSSHILSVWNLLCLGFNQFRLFKFKKKSFSLNDITDWVQYDNQLASDWVVKNFGKIVASELTSPIFNGFYFQSLNNSSAAMAAAVLAFSAHNPKTMTLTSGIGSLPKKLAENLNVKTGALVSEIIQTSSGVTVISDMGDFNAEHVIVTVPSPFAKKMIQNPDGEMSSLFETVYSSSILVSLLTHGDWQPNSKICSAYGFLVNPQLNSKIAALTIENNKCQTRKKQGYLINIMLSDKWAKKFLHLSSEEIYTKIQPDVEKIFPAIYSSIHKKELFRWQYAMPCAPIGRAIAVREYRNTRNPNNRVWLAGDYLGFPWTDSAAETGLWAAGQVQTSLARCPKSRGKITITLSGK
ncbi:MAG TPA: FAD-dependent oxidoreductase, partial [Gammaproteobacteria bacterium]|nr:FAD-dependent oxidoreductase [Gammaproteobacteria bacterium]